MAINPNTIKTLFRKLAPVADDVAKGVVKYGDDVVKYGDDTAKILYGGSKGLGFSTLGDKLGLGFSNAKVNPRALPNLSGYVEIGPLGDEITFFDNLRNTVGINGKRYTYPYRYSPQNALKERLLNKRTGLGKATDFDDSYTGTINVLGLQFPAEQLVPKYGLDAYRPHKNTALGRWYADNMRMMGLNPFNDVDYLPF